MIVGTAGHIDHGKTALVKALTGVDADRLQEEKLRGITIDLGFAYADLGGGVVTGFVDVPGHERFVHTMLAGASGIDFALLVVAADDGVMPQTREHVEILDLLGVTRGVVALTKADLAGPERRAEVAGEVAALLAPTGLAGAEVLAVSSVTGEGVAALTARLAAAERATPLRAGGGRFRLAVDRVFTLAGAGTVVTGTVLSGAVAVGDQLVVSPGGIEVRVRSIHAQNQAAARGTAGERCALNLAGDGVSREAIRRGDMVVDPGLHAPTDRIDATLRVLGSEPKPLAAGVPARLHLGSAEVGVRVVPLAGAVAPGARVPVQLVLDAPVAAAVGDRFVLRDASERRTMGGGRLLDLRAPARRRRAPERLQLLAAAAETAPERGLAAMLAVGPVDLAGFARDRAVPAAETAMAAAAAGATLLDGTLAVSAAALAKLRGGLVEELALWHAANPEQQGMGRERLRLRLGPRLPAPTFLAFLKAEVEAGRAVADGAFVRLPGHEVRLVPGDAALWMAIAPNLGGDARFRPPRVRDLAGLLGVDEREVRRVLKLCARIGQVDEIAHDHFFARETTAEMVAICVDVAAGTRQGAFTAAEFRDRVWNGRKVAIEILDFLDRHGVTLRRGDLRRINPRRLDLFGVFAGAGGMSRAAGSAAGGGGDGGLGGALEVEPAGGGRLPGG